MPADKFVPVRCSLSAFLQPKMVHAREGIGVITLHGVPAIEIAHRPAVLRKQRAVLLLRAGGEFETDEKQAVFGDKCLDGGNGHAAFLHVEQQVAALASAIKIVKTANATMRRLKQVLTATADVGGIGRIAAFGDESARRHYIAPP